MTRIEDPYWIAVDDLSDAPRVWAICDRCDAEALVIIADAGKCAAYKEFIEQHQNCLEKNK